MVAVPPSTLLGYGIPIRRGKDTTRISPSDTVALITVEKLGALAGKDFAIMRVETKREMVGNLLGFLIRQTAAVAFLSTLPTDDARRGRNGRIPEQEIGVFTTTTRFSQL